MSMARTASRDRLAPSPDDRADPAAADGERADARLRRTAARPETAGESRHRRAAHRQCRGAAVVHQRRRQCGRGQSPCLSARQLAGAVRHRAGRRSAVGDQAEEHTSELQSLMRISYAVFCLKKKTEQPTHTHLSTRSHHTDTYYTIIYTNT